MPEANSKPKAASKVAKKTASKKVAAKKKPVKKTPTRSRSVTTKKTKPKKTEKESVKSRTKTVRKTATPRSKEKAEPMKTVVLPSRMSIRAREKALVYAQEFEKRLHKPAYALTMTFGAIFCLIGGALTLSQSNNQLSCGAACVAQLIGGVSEDLYNTASDPNIVDPTTNPETGSSEPPIDAIDETQTNPDSATDTNTVTTEPVPSPSVLMISPLPQEIAEDTDVAVEVVSLNSLRAKINGITVSGGEFVKELQMMPLLGDKYRIFIPASNLEPTTYTLRVYGQSTVDDEPRIYTLGRFTVPEPAVETTTSDPINTVVEEGVDALEQDVPLDTPPIDTTSEEIDLTKDEVVMDDSPTNVEEDVEVTVETVEGVFEPQLRISAPSRVEGIATVKVETNLTGYISFYLRRTQTTERQFVGRVLAPVQSFNFNSAKFPNGDYELAAQSIFDAKPFRSESQKLSIENPTAQIEPADSAINTDPVEESREILIVSEDMLRVEQEPLPRISDPTPVIENVQEDEGSSDINLDSVESSVQPDEFLAEPIRLRAIEKLQSDPELIDSLFRNYAVAVQSGNTDLIRAARSEIENYRLSLVDQALSDESDRFIADDLSQSLDQEIDAIAVKVETFETLRRERTEEGSTLDSDGDGITDTDERLLFKTDPFSADSDGDGFTDGVEIVKGFDPKNSASEASIVYKSPKETVGIVSSASLQVTDVTPDIQLPQTPDDVQEVQATVRGIGLPNSFVTLYVFSTPTVVTVKTEADGSFEYTFSKELEDGEHQVFVALTDNTGDIVAQSEPFTFVKRAEAFTAVDAEAAILATESGSLVNTPVSTYGTVLSMSVLALGVLLILLGIGLRANKPEEINIEATA